MGFDLTKLSEASRMLSECKSFNGVKKIRDVAIAAQQYARASALGLEALNHSNEIKMMADRKLGEFLLEIHAQPGRPKNGSTPGTISKKAQLQDLGVSKTQSHRFEQMAKVPQEVFDKIVNADNATDEGREITASSVLEWSKPHVANNSGENEWYTPPEIIEAAREAMGSIDLDPASSKVAQKNVRAAKYYTAKQDGLTKPWDGNVWLNPPYSRELIAEFISKLVAEYCAGDVVQAVVLTNNATDTEWWQQLASRCDACCFLRGRVSFLDESGEPVRKPLQGQTVIYLGSRIQEFTDEFGVLGQVLESEHGEIS